MYCPRCQVACVEDCDHLAQCERCLYAFCSICCDSWHPGTECLDPIEVCIVSSCVTCSCQCLCVAMHAQMHTYIQAHRYIWPSLTRAHVNVYVHIYVCAYQQELHVPMQTALLTLLPLLTTPPLSPFTHT